MWGPRHLSMVPFYMSDGLNFYLTCKEGRVFLGRSTEDGLVKYPEQ